MDPPTDLWLGLLGCLGAQAVGVPQTRACFLLLVLFPSEAAMSFLWTQGVSWGKTQTELSFFSNAGPTKHIWDPRGP